MQESGSSMDERGRSQRPNRPANPTGRPANARPNSRESQRPAEKPRGGLLSRYGDQQATGTPPDGTGQQRLRGALDAITGQARRLGDGFRKATDGFRSPQAGEWKATDFDPRTLREWDELDEAPFEVPPDPDAPFDESRRLPSSGKRTGRAPGGWDDDEWDAGWETGTWDTGWATGYEPSAGYGQSGHYDESGLWVPGRERGYTGEEDALSESLHTLAMLGAVGKPIGRVERVRLLMRRRPAAAAMLAFFLLGFMLTCCAPLIPVLRLGYDAADAANRVSNLQSIFSGGTAAIFNGTKLQAAKAEVDGITHDLYEINGAMNIAGAPLAAVSPSMRNYRLLTRIGFDLTASADEGLDVARTLLLPLQGGALSSESGTPGITPADIQQARAVLADASLRVDDAVAAYAQLDVGSLPSQLQPSGKYGKYLGLLPTAKGALGEMNVLLDSAGALLGVGQPANYLILAMDRSELRPGGGFQGNYGILTLEGGKQSASNPVSLNDVYTLDQAYFQKTHGSADIHDCRGLNLDNPPQYYWWWPYRMYGGEDPCPFNWGLRDSSLSPDFPFNARTAMQIAEDSGLVPNNHKLQGAIAFTPELIAELLQPSVFGPLTLPQWNTTVNTDNLEYTIHQFQLGGAGGAKDAPRKQFTHDLSQALVAELKGAHGEKLKAVLNVVEKALKNKELQLYFADPNAELILRQLGLASEVNRGGGDGFFVVDTNFGGNKANAYVREDQTDYVQLLPNGGALHHLRIAVTYKMDGPVFDGLEAQKDYIELQRTYLPGDATILGYTGFTPSLYTTSCGPGMMSIISDCSSLHILRQPDTLSDVSGRAMVLGGLDVLCYGDGRSGIETNNTFGRLLDHVVEAQTCDAMAQANKAVSHTQEIYIDFYTPHAFAMDAKGHGTYSELVEKQPGSNDYLTVYVDQSQLHSASPREISFTGGTLGALALHDAYEQVLAGTKPSLATAKLDSNATVSINF